MVGVSEHKTGIKMDVYHLQVQPVKNFDLSLLNLPSFGKVCPVGDDVAG